MPFAVAEYVYRCVTPSSDPYFYRHVRLWQNVHYFGLQRVSESVIYRRQGVPNSMAILGYYRAIYRSNVWRTRSHLYTSYDQKLEKFECVCRNVSAALQLKSSSLFSISRSIIDLPYIVPLLGVYVGGKITRYLLSSICI